MKTRVKNIISIVLSLGVVGVAAVGSAAAADVLLESDFGVCTEPRDSQGVGHFKGVLPAGWSDHFVGWNKSQITSRVIQEDGKKFLRFQVSDIDNMNSGNPGFIGDLPGLANGEYYRVTIRARNRSGGPLFLGLRLGEPTYGFRWSRQISPSPEWVEKTWCFKLSLEKGEGLNFFLVPGGVGTIDVANIRVERLTTPEEIAASTPRPAPGTKNFFRNSRLPLGLQAGWNLGRMSSVATALPDANNPGPSGCAALKLESNGQTDSFDETTKGMRFFTEPFQVADPTVKNYVGFFYKGKGEWTSDAGGANEKLKPTTKWTWVTLEFTPGITDKSYTLSFLGSGVLWLDSFCAWSGDRNRPYESAGECEVALGLPPSDIAETRIQFADEPAEVVYLVTGKGKGGVLKARVTNVYGKTENLPDVNLDSKTLRGTIRFDIFPRTPYGLFRVETWVERDGKPVSPINEIVVTRLQRPVYWGKDAPDSPFGGHCLSVDKTIKTLKAGGVNWTRLHDAGTEYIGWWYLEPEKGKWRFFDEDIQRYRNNHVKIFAQFGTAPRWASYLSKLKDGPENPGFMDFYISRYFPPLNMDDFANYVKTVTARYKGVIDEYFVWNEPYYTGWWPMSYDKVKKEYVTSENPQADFAELMKTAYTAAKSVDPTVKIAGFNTCGWEPGEKWTKGVYDAGGYPFCDVVDYHFYTTYPQGFPGSHTEATYGGAVGYIRQKEGKLDKPVYMTEGAGRPGDPNYNFAGPTINYGLYKNALPYDPDEDTIQRADVLCKFVLDLLSHNVRKVFLYSSHCYWNLGSQGSSDFVTLLGGDGFADVSLAAHSNLAVNLEDKKFLKAITLAEGIYAYLFADAKSTVAVISGKPGCRAYTLPDTAGLSVVDLFGNPLPAGAMYKGTLLYISGNISPEAMESKLLRQ